MAGRWIVNHAPEHDTNGALNFAVEERNSGVLIGFIGIGGDNTHAGMGYWYGKPFWKKDYATEARRMTVALGFEELGLKQIAASHLKEYLTSGRAPQKMGMLHEGKRWHYVPIWDTHR